MLAGGALFSSATAQEVLPAPPSPFKGQIGLSVKDSKSDFPQPVKTAKGAPNIVIILLDDVGYGASSTFGGPSDTPILDKLAGSGLRYTQFHTTSISSPTRASLLTGRNLAKNFALGAQRYYYKQVTGDSGSGAFLGDFKGESYGFGPALLWIPGSSGRLSLIGKWLFDSHHENRMKGDYGQIIVSYKF